jgi:hypothetical protein
MAAPSAELVRVRTPHSAAANFPQAQTGKFPRCPRFDLSGLLARSEPSSWPSALAFMVRAPAVRLALYVHHLC